MLRQHIGALIKARRKRLRLRQEDLAAQMGMSRAALANVETGRQNLLVPHLYRFAAALDLKVTDLLPDPADIENTVEADDLPLPENLSRAQRAQIARLMRGGMTGPDQTEDNDHATRKTARPRKGSK